VCATRVRRFCSNRLVRRTKPSNKNAVCGALLGVVRCSLNTVPYRTVREYRKVLPQDYRQVAPFSGKGLFVPVLSFLVLFCEATSRSRCDVTFDIVRPMSSRSVPYRGVTTIIVAPVFGYVASPDQCYRSLPNKELSPDDPN
jgi:hypothetical protein